MTDNVVGIALGVALFLIFVVGLGLMFYSGCED